MDKFSLKSLLERGQECEIGIIKEKAEKEVEQSIKKIKPDFSAHGNRGRDLSAENALPMYLQEHAIALELVLVLKVLKHFSTRSVNFFFFIPCEKMKVKE